MKKKILLIPLVLLLAISLVTINLVATGCSAPAKEVPAKEVTVGCKAFTEQLILGQLMAQLLKDRGFKVNLASDLSSMALRAGQENGDIDIVADYTGTVWMADLGHEYKAGIDNNELYHLVKEEDKGNGIIWLNPIWCNNTFGLASWPDFVKEHNLKTLSDLAALYREKEGKIKTFVSFEFSARPDGLPALEEFYDFEVGRASLMTGAPGASLTGLEKRQCEVAMVFGTDSTIAKYGWHVYLDDQAFFPPYDLTPYVRAEVLDKHPEIVDILNELVATFPGGGKPATTEIVAEGQEVMQGLNSKADIEKMLPEEVAREYLLTHGLIKE